MALRFVPLAALAVLLAGPGVPRAAAETPAAPMIAQACAGCHGQAGEGESPVPKIAGKDRGLFVRAMTEFQADGREATIMNRIARGYTEAEIAALADYFASLR